MHRFYKRMLLSDAIFPSGENFVLAADLQASLSGSLGTPSVRENVVSDIDITRLRSLFENVDQVVTGSEHIPFDIGPFVSVTRVSVETAG